MVILLRWFVPETRQAVVLQELGKLTWGVLMKFSYLYAVTPACLRSAFMVSSSAAAKFFTFPSIVLIISS